MTESLDVMPKTTEQTLIIRINMLKVLYIRVSVEFRCVQTIGYFVTGNIYFYASPSLDWQEAQCSRLVRSSVRPLPNF